MSKESQATLDLPPLHQVGFVVKNLDEAIAKYKPLFGDFNTMDADDMTWDYYGRPENSTLKIAMASSGDVEIELIEWVSGECPHKDFLDEGHEGMHHLCFLVDDCEAMMEKAKKFGYVSAWYKRFQEGLAAAYMKREGDPLYMEFFERKI